MDSKKISCPNIGCNQKFDVNDVDENLFDLMLHKIRSSDA